MAARYQMTPQALLKELEKNNGVQEVAQQVLHVKVVDFLQEHAKIEDVAPAPKEG